MNFLDYFLIGVGLSMDAFAVAVCKGLSMKRFKISYALVIGLYFGIFQAGMPVIGYFLGTQFRDYITAFDHWIAFTLLAVIGVNMIRESMDKSAENVNPSIAFGTMLVLALATSIDALAVGVTFAFEEANIAVAAAIIGATTFILSALGTWVGSVFGVKYKSRAELAGGLILVAMGIKFLVEGLIN